MELAIIGSDIQEVIGSAVAIQLLSGGKIPLWAGALMTGIDTFTFLFLENYGLRKLEAFFCVLIATMCCTFGYMYISSAPPQLDILKRVFVPGCTNCTSKVTEQAVGILGAVIMPHNIYLHSALVLSREINRDKEQSVKEGILYNSIESALALTASFIINLFVVCIFGKMFYGKDTDGHITLLTAGDELKKYDCPTGTNRTVFNSTSPSPSVPCSPGPFWIIWGIGLLAAGQSSTMTGTYAGQFVMEGFLNIKWPRWKRVLLTRSIAMAPTILCATVFSSYLDVLDELLNVEQSLLLPFALLPVLHMTNSRRIMGNFKNKWWMTIIVWLLALIVMGANGYLVVGQTVNSQVWKSVVGALFPIYIIVVLYYCLGPSLAMKVIVWFKSNFRLVRRHEVNYAAPDEDLSEGETFNSDQPLIQ
jgi:natural resistance-associated macrophage protein